MIPHFFATLDPSITSFLNGVQFFNSEQTSEMLAAEFLWFFGGVSFSFALGAFSMVIRATKGAAREIDL
ncbi:MAG TPA: hypothetical protein VG838_13750 [Opitutaceae bacterium]|nr:hypothetical protein [Opitutaceae bacterium]